MQGGALLWKRRSALLYTFGSWTVFGSILFYSSRYIQKREEEPQVPREEERSAGNKMGVTTISEDGLRQTTVYRPAENFTVTTTVVYKPNFVPYTTRLYNYVQSFFDDSGGNEK
ncbi:small integral membrane protein 26 [Sphaerodactylus townsendi]|uniref:small integral membrane protein 26 n=1 Tax=Sphaerodactylus townsendi TaxID=933632 RepID=UPI002025BCFD|nr:small integral membrane protein 26 [Sphaerodactylus townsendi]